MKAMQWMFAALVLIGLGACATNTQPTTPNYVVDQSAYGNNCANCGTVSSINARTVAAKPNVAGAVIGAIIGGVAGHQFGSGKGNDAATAGGAVAGGAVGSQINKGENSTVYDMVIRMDNGVTQTMTVAGLGNLRTGSRVRISGDHIVPM